MSRLLQQALTDLEERYAEACVSTQVELETPRALLKIGIAIVGALHRLDKSAEIERRIIRMTRRACEALEGGQSLLDESLDKGEIGGNNHKKEETSNGDTAPLHMRSMRQELPVGELEPEVLQDAGRES